MHSTSSSSYTIWLVLMAINLVWLLPGCVRRRMTVRTNPPGAMVYVDHQSVGTTPVSTNFVYYGTRQFEIVKDGYRTEKFMRRFNPPWYEWPVLDFVSETIWPFEKRDERIVDVQMTPEIDVPTEALIRSGEELRSQASRGFAVSPPPSAGGPTASNDVIPFGDVPFSSSPLSTISPPFQPPTLPNAPFFEVPPVSMPAANVAPGASYRKDLGQ